MFSSSCRHQDHESAAINIAAAANMRYVMEELTSSFKNNTGTNCELIISSSGKLTAQILVGAPFDIFVSANMKYPAEIYHQGKAIYPPKSYAHGQLVLWSMTQGESLSIKSLTNASIKHVAIANPKTAPYGIAAIEILSHYNLNQTLESKLVYGESISQTNQFILSKSADIGITSMSVVLSPKMKNKGNWIALDSKLHSPIEQGVVLIKHEKYDSKKAKTFYDYLFSEQARQILKKYGYLVNE